MQMKPKWSATGKKSLPIVYESLDIYLDGVRLQFDEEAPFLGMIIDTWESQCIKIANTISRNSSSICRVKKMFPPTSLKILYSG
jgi:hypothetical protein